MYVSPLVDRMRKRKAFADTELDSSTHIFTAPYSNRTLTALPITAQLPGVINYSPIQQSMIRHESDLSIPVIETMKSNDHQESVSPPLRIRIIEDAKLKHMNQQTNQHSVFGPSEVKPRLSFSIESIIGIK